MVHRRLVLTQMIPITRPAVYTAVNWVTESSVRYTFTYVDGNGAVHEIASIEGGQGYSLYRRYPVYPGNRQRSASESPYICRRLFY